MRLEISETVTGASRAQAVKPGTNPVLFGNGPNAHVLLESAYVGATAAAVGNRGAGWELWNHNGRGQVVLVHAPDYARRTAVPPNGHTPVRHGDVFECFPFQVRVFFDPAEVNAEGEDWRAWDRQVTEAVRAVHTELVREYGRTVIDRETEFTDEYVQKLEERIAEVAALTEGFPPDDLTATPLGDHMAGVAVRSELLNRLVSRAGVRGDRPPAHAVKEGWERLRTSLRTLEDELDDLVTRAEAALSLRAGDDLTQSVITVEKKFWEVWQVLLRGRSGPPVPTRRYLALRRLKKEVKDIWYGYGPLQELLDDPTVAEIMVVDRDHIFIEKAGRIENTGRRFIDDKSTENIIGKICNLAGRSINTSEPLVDARMEDGSRVNAIIPPLALKGPCLTVRRFPTKRLTIDELIARGSLTVPVKNFLKAAVETRRNVIVAGGTGTGKTTMLNCLSGFIPDHERIVTIEDTAELQLHKEHVVTLQARAKNAEGQGAKTIRDLVKNSLRMRPDRIVIGECRGGEALDMLQAMNTGHDGSLTTLHANSPHDCVGRLEVLCQMQEDVKLPVEAIHRQIVSAVDLVVQLAVVYTPQGPRKVVTEVAELAGIDPEGGIRIVSLFNRSLGGLGPIRSTGHLPSFVAELVAAGKVADPLDLLRDGADEPVVAAPTHAA